MHRRASHAILMHRREFSTSRRRRVASQRVAGPIVVIQVKIVQNELMVEIYSKSLVRAISKVLLMKFS